MTTTGLKALTQKFATADARMAAELAPVVAEGVHLIGEQAKSNASFSSQIPGQEHETSAFLSGTVGFTELGYPHAGKVATFEGDGVAPAPFMAQVYGGPGEHEMMSHPFLGPAAEAEREPFKAAVAVAVRQVLS
jgi:hypothetical protein